MGRPKLDNPANITTVVRLDVNTNKRLVEYCEKNNVSKGYVVRQAIIQYLGNENK